MKLLILNAAEVEALLPMRACIAVMADALTAHARGNIQQPLRAVFKPQGGAGFLGLMPCHDNPARGLDAHQGGVLLSDGATGVPLALANASAITAIRTAAVSGVATQLLARADACELAIVGAGVEARTHLEAMSCVRPLRRARVVARQIEHARQFVAEVQARYSFPLEPSANVAEAISGADLIVTATNARAPVLRREWITDGAHINAVGACTPAARELDAATIAAATLFVDSRESAQAEAGDYLLAFAEGAISRDHIRAELGEVLTGANAGRTAADEITVFESLGLAAEDLAAAAYVYQQAQTTGAGTWVEF